MHLSWLLPAASLFLACCAPIAGQIAKQKSSIQGVVLESSDEVRENAFFNDVTAAVPPSAGVAVAVRRHGEGKWLRTVTTDNEGRFEFQGLPAGFYDIQTSGDPVLKEENFELAIGKTAWVTLNEDLQNELADVPHGWLEAHVVDQNGRDLDGAVLHFTAVKGSSDKAQRDCSTDSDPSDTQNNILFTKPSDGNGRILLHAVPACTYTIHANLPGVASSDPQEVRVGSRDRVTPTFRISVPEGLGAIHGLCVDLDCPETLRLTLGKKTLELIIQPAPDGLVYDDDRSDAQVFHSKIEIRHLLPGTYEIADTESGLKSDPFEIKANETTNLLIRAARDSNLDKRLEVLPSALIVSAWQRVDSERATLEDVNIEIVTSTEEVAGNCSTASDGRCAAIPLKPGRYTMTASLEGYDPQTESIEIGSSNWTERDIFLNPVSQGQGGPAAMPLREPDHSPGFGSFRGFIDKFFSTDMPEVVLVSPTGREENLLVRKSFFESTEEWLPGQYKARYRFSKRDAFKTATLEIKAGDTTFLPILSADEDPLITQTLGGLQVQVTDPMNRPLTDARVEIERVQPFGARTKNVDDDVNGSECRTDRNGVCILAPVIAGKYAVYAEAPGFQDSGRRLVSVIPRRLVRIKLQQSSKISHDALHVGSLHGHVQGKNGPHVLGIALLAEAGITRCAPITDSSFTFNWAPATNEALLTISGPGFSEATEHVKVLPERISELPDLKLVPGTSPFTTMNCPP